MTGLGVFRDDFYNAVSVLPQSQYGTTAQNGGVLAASLMAGSGDCYAALSGQTTAQAITTDSAVNIITQLQQAVATAYKANVSGLGANVSPPPGVPNLFNVTWTLTVINNNTASGAITLTGGTGVTVNGTNTIAITTSRAYVCSITSSTALVLQNVASGTV